MKTWLCSGRAICQPIGHRITRTNCEQQRLWLWRSPMPSIRFWKMTTSIRNDLEDWKMEETDGRRIVFYKGKNYIPKTWNCDGTLYECSTIMNSLDTPEKLETYNAVSALYWWPGIRSFVKNYVKGCGTANGSNRPEPLTPLIYSSGRGWMHSTLR